MCSMKVPMLILTAMDSQILYSRDGYSGKTSKASNRESTEMKQAWGETGNDHRWLYCQRCPILFYYKLLRGVYGGAKFSIPSQFAESVYNSMPL